MVLRVFCRRGKIADELETGSAPFNPKPQD
jgi:hypothetical protein